MKLQQVLRDLIKTYDIVQGKISGDPNAADSKSDQDKTGETGGQTGGIAGQAL